jgi:hypothetical protein
MPIDNRQYDSAIEFIKDDREFSKLIGNVSNSDDRLRLKAYELYEDFYLNRPEHMRVVLRGEDDDAVEIYIPSAKKCIEAIKRYLAIEFDYLLDPDSGTEVDHQALDAELSKLFVEQEIATKYNQTIRYCLVKGDSLLHLSAVPWERPGKRIRVDELKPEHYFPIEDFATGATIGCHIVDVIRNPRNSPSTKRSNEEWLVRRQTYRRVRNDKGVPTGRITTELTLWEIGKWDDRVSTNELKRIDVVVEERELPELITNIPVYHWRNNTPPNSSFGMSELAGVESIINAINQAATDEDLTLITQGIGVYWSDASPPVDENGDEVEWEIGPGSVVQVASGAKFNRVNGVASLAPFHEHIKLLDENMQQALGVPDVAIGMVDVQAVESGIALQLKFGPLLAHNAEKMPSIQRVTDEFLSDLLDWLQFYEGIARNGCEIGAVYGDPMPQNKSQQTTDILAIWSGAPGVFPVVDWLYERLNEIHGWDLADPDFQQALADAKAISEASAPPDPFAGQMLDENGQPVEGETDDQGNPLPGNKGNAIPFPKIGA